MLNGTGIWVVNENSASVLPAKSHTHQACRRPDDVSIPAIGQKRTPNVMQQVITGWNGSVAEIVAQAPQAAAAGQKQPPVASLVFPQVAYCGRR
jgi:hypothetical protein